MHWIEKTNRGLKMLDQVMQGIEKVLEKLLRDTNVMQFGFTSDKSTTEAIFIVREISWKTQEAIPHICGFGEGI